MLTVTVTVSVAFRYVSIMGYKNAVEMHVRRSLDKFLSMEN